jgi:hypothetical protein
MVELSGGTWEKLRKIFPAGHHEEVARILKNEVEIICRFSKKWTSLVSKDFVCVVGFSGGRVLKVEELREFGTVGTLAPSSFPYPRRRCGCLNPPTPLSEH